MRRIFALGVAALAFTGIAPWPSLRVPVPRGGYGGAGCGQPRLGRVVAGGGRFRAMRPAASRSYAADPAFLNFRRAAAWAPAARWRWTARAISGWRNAAGANDCAGSKLDPIMEFDAKGNFLKAFGAGKLLFPHGFFHRHKDHIGVTDGHVGGGIGYDVLEFDQDGKVLRTLARPVSAVATARVSANPMPCWWRPTATFLSATAMTPDPVTMPGWWCSTPRAVFLRQWGSHGIGPGQLEVPALSGDGQKGKSLCRRPLEQSPSRNSTRNGKLLQIFTQFGRPSGIAIDKHDILYATDSESRTAPGQYGHPSRLEARHPHRQRA